MTTLVECSVCGEQIGKMGIGQHAGRHRREFRESVGRAPRSYDEVRRYYRGEVDPESPQARLDEFQRGDGRGGDR